MKCPHCGNEMKNIMHFENGKQFAFHECRNCFTKTHQKRIHFEDLKKGDSYENLSNTKRVHSQWLC